MDSSFWLLTGLIFLPTLGALLVWLLPRNDDLIRLTTLFVTLGTFALSVLGFFSFDATKFQVGAAQMQNLLSVDWIPSFNIQYMLGVDGISFPLILLTTFLSVFAMGAAWSIKKHVKAYCILFLLLETGMIGVFMALDLFLFYIFWEVMLLPMYFLIGVWGGPRREYAAIKFFLYTLFGSVLMLIAILMLYFNSDLTELTPQQLADSGVFSVPAVADGDTPSEDAVNTAFTEWKTSKAPLAVSYVESEAEGRELHTFNILALQKMGQTTKLFDDFGIDEDGNPIKFLGKGMQWWAFLLLLIGFIIKVPSVPFHTWLPDAHVEAPTPISMILAGVLLKMGGYGIIRICYPICPEAGFELAWLVCTLGVVSMVYGAFAALAQKDFKRLVAYSSVSHMGYVMLGFGVWSAYAGTNYDPRYWSMGIQGAMFQMIGHGISSAGMFFMVGVIYDRVHHRDLNQFGGLFAKMPIYSGLAMGIFFAGLGLPGLCGFIGEVLVVLSVWTFSKALAIVSAAVVILTAGYILWVIQRVYLGPEYKGPHAEEIKPITMREFSIAAPLLIVAIWFGVYPQVVLNYLTPTVNQTVNELTEWTKQHDADQVTAEKEMADAKQEQAKIPDTKQDRLEPVAVIPEQPIKPAS